MSRNNKSTSSYFICGKHPVLEALKNSKRSVKSIYVTQNCLNTLDNALKGYKYQIVDNKFINKLLKSDDFNHQGIAINVSKLSNNSIKEVVGEAQDFEYHRILALDQITDPHNFGAILRTASAFGIDTIITTKDNAAKDSAVVAKIACGALEHLNICYVSNLTQSLELLKEHNYWVIGMDAAADTDVSKLSGYKKACLVLGAEGAGMRKLTKDSCDLLVKINIDARMESLNVSNAAAIAMYELSK